MPGYTEYVLAEGSFSYGQAVAVITAYRNVFIQDDPGMHFRRVIRNAEGQRRWRCRNSEPDAGKVLNTRLASGRSSQTINVIRFHPSGRVFSGRRGFFHLLHQ
ncbi:DUF905 family protein [Escherichia coli]|uniref:DUF905 family protein n=1 Tax=Escherichia coli TaxID=562 RepID=UPI003466AC03